MALAKMNELCKKVTLKDLSNILGVSVTTAQKVKIDILEQKNQKKEKKRKYLIVSDIYEYFDLN